MKLYFAAPLFTTAERDWNVALVAAIRATGHEVYLPQENEPGKRAPEIFAVDVAGIDWADGLVAVMDGPDPDSGTAWEVGYAYGKGKPIILVRTDIRIASSGGAATTRCSRSRQPSASTCRQAPRMRFRARLSMRCGGWKHRAEAGRPH